MATQDLTQLTFASDSASLIAVDIATEYRVLQLELDGKATREFSAYKFQLGVKVLEATTKRNLLALGSYDQRVRDLPNEASLMSNSSVS